MTTWKQFKEAVEAQGVKDDSVIDFIDWSGDWPSSGRILRVDDKDGWMSIT